MNTRSELLSKIPTVLLPEEITSVRLIEGGFNNRNILINESWLIKEYLVRDESNDPVSLRFLREKETLQLLKGNTHAPYLLKYYDNTKNYFIVRKWVEGQPFRTDQVQDHIKKLINVILSIHSITDSTSGDFYYFDVIKRYLQEYKKMISDSSAQNTQFAKLPQFHKLNQFFHAHLNQIQEFDSTKPAVRIHGDLVLSNIILTQSKKEVVIIDWEYSTLGDPLIDLAYLLSQNHLSPNVQQNIIENYKKMGRIQVDLNELNVYCDLMIFMSGLWYAIHSARLRLSHSALIGHQIPFTKFIKLALDQFQVLNMTEK